jgi:hypothetical protein
MIVHQHFSAIASGACAFCNNVNLRNELNAFIAFVENCIYAETKHSVLFIIYAKKVEPKCCFGRLPREILILIGKRAIASAAAASAAE